MLYPLIGTPIPLTYDVLLLKIKNIIAGIVTPPIAATIGKDALFTSDKCPLITSILISQPTTKKKIAIKKIIYKLVQIKIRGIFLYDEI